MGRKFCPEAFGGRTFEAEVLPQSHRSKHKGFWINPGLILIWNFLCRFVGQSGLNHSASSRFQRRGLSHLATGLGLLRRVKSVGGGGCLVWNLALTFLRCGLRWGRTDARLECRCDPRELGGFVPCTPCNRTRPAQPLDTCRFVALSCGKSQSLIILPCTRPASKPPRCPHSPRAWRRQPPSASSADRRLLPFCPHDPVPVGPLVRASPGPQRRCPRGL